MMCPRCEKPYETPWMVLGKQLEVYCPDCAIATMEEMFKERKRALQKLSEN